jgi:diacylglycerol kinase family enzyme
MRILLVVNPTATNVSPSRVAVVENELRARHDVRVEMTDHRDHATELALAALADDVDCVAVLGGDGTLNEVVNAIAGTDCTLAVLPGGSTNVFARTLGLPDDLARAARATSDALASGWVHRIGLGAVNGRYFTFHTGIGFDAAIVERVEHHSRLKRRFGHALFAYCGVRLFFSYDRRHPHFRVVIDDEPTKVMATADGPGTDGNDEDGYFTVVQNTDPYTFVGERPFTVAPAATLDRGLAITTVGSMSIRRFVPVILDALVNRKGLRASRTVTKHENVRSATVSRITTSPPRSMPFQVDGDFLGEADDLRFTHHPDVLHIVLPLVPR